MLKANPLIGLAFFVFASHILNMEKKNDNLENCFEKKLSYCAKCRNFHISDGFSLTMDNGNLAIAFDMTKSCIFKTDLKSITDLIKLKDMPVWVSMSDRKRLEYLLPHVTGVSMMDESCPFYTEIMIDGWNK